MRKAPAFYPLEIYDLGKKEKGLLVKILNLGRDQKIFRLKELEGRLDIRLRYILDATEEKKPKKADVVHSKWVSLYSYVMHEFREACLRRRNDSRVGPDARAEAQSILDEIDELRELGLSSGRYKTDMHLFNDKFLNLSTANKQIDERFLGTYIGLRYGSDMQRLVISAVHLSHADDAGRDIFRAQLLNENTERDTRGVAFELGAYLYLWGFLNSNEGFEYYALKPDNFDRTVLFGIMATLNRHGVPHAKQCVFIKTTEIERLKQCSCDLGATHIAEFRERARGLVDVNLETKQSSVALTGDRLVDLGNFLEPAIVDPAALGRLHHVPTNVTISGPRRGL